MNKAGPAVVVSDVRRFGSCVGTGRNSHWLPYDFGQLQAANRPGKYVTENSTHNADCIFGRAHNSRVGPASSMFVRVVHLALTEAGGL